MWTFINSIRGYHKLWFKMYCKHLELWLFFRSIGVYKRINRVNERTRNSHCKQTLGKLYFQRIATNFCISVFLNIVSRNLYNFPRFVNFCSRNRAVVQKRSYLKTFAIHFSTKRNILSENSTIRMSQAIQFLVKSGLFIFNDPNEVAGQIDGARRASTYLDFFLTRIISRTSLPCP